MSITFEREPIPHSLTFEPPLADLVAQCAKFTTWRVANEQDFQPGDPLTLQVRYEGEKRAFGFANITSVRKMTFGTLIPDDFVGHEPFTSHEELVQTYKRYYGDQVSDETPVTVIHFLTRVVANRPNDLNETDVIVFSEQAAA